MRRPWLAVGPAQRGQTELPRRGRGDEDGAGRLGPIINGSCAPRTIGAMGPAAALRELANLEALVDIVLPCTHVLFHLNVGRAYCVVNNFRYVGNSQIERGPRQPTALSIQVEFL